MTYIIKTAARVDARINGETIELELEAGEHDLRPEIAELLVSQGIAEKVAAQPKTKTSKTKPTDTEEKN